LTRSLHSLHSLRFTSIHSLIPTIFPHSLALFFSSTNRRYAVSFRAANKTKHCLVRKEDRWYVIGEQRFTSLGKMVAHYQEKPLFRKVKLKYVPLLIPSFSLATQASSLSSSLLLCDSTHPPTPRCDVYTDLLHCTALPPL
jgi:hypothetical protein